MEKALLLAGQALGVGRRLEPANVTRRWRRPVRKEEDVLLRAGPLVRSNLN